MTLAELIIYPLKGCRGLSVEACVVTRSGLKHDRAFMLSDQDGSPITEKSHPLMSTLAFLVSGETVWTTAPGMPSIELASPNASSWFSTLLECDCVLAATSRENQFEFEPVSMFSRQSLAALNFMLVRPFDRLRFRPNLIVDTKCEAFAETNWAGLQTGTVHFKGVGACVRPHLLAADLPWSRAHIARQKAVQTKVTSPSGRLIFGTYLSVDVEGQLMVGDSCLQVGC